jgi:hypothetical protein
MDFNHRWLAIGVGIYLAVGVFAAVMAFRSGCP